MLINVLINVWLNYMNYMNISEFPWQSHSFILNFKCISKCPQSQQDNQWWQIPRPATCQWLAMFTPLKSKMEFLTTWHTFWCHDTLFDVRCVSYVMTNFLLSWSILDFMTNLFTSWHIFYFMTNFWRYDKYFYVMTCSWFYDKHFDIMMSFWHLTHFWHHDKLLT